MKTPNPIRVSIQVCPPTLGRSVQRPQVLLRRTKVLLCGVAVLAVFGAKDLRIDAQAQQLKRSNATSSQPNATVSATDDRPRPVRGTDDSSVIKRIVLFPVRLGKFPVRLGKRALSGLGLRAENAHSKNSRTRSKSNARAINIAPAELNKLPTSAPIMLDLSAPTLDSKEESPKVISAVKPAYPAIAAARRISGKVSVDVEIDKNGLVTETRAHSGHSILQRAAQDAAMRWRFEPTSQSEGIRRATLSFTFLKISSLTVEDGFRAPYQMIVRWEGITIASPVSGRPASQTFELNNDYVLKVAFDSLGQISGGIVVPKYYGEECEPSWTEPDHLVGLTEDESKMVLTRVNELRSLGLLVHKGRLGIVTNSKLRLLDQYQSAFVRRLLNRTAVDSGASGSTTHSLSIYFIRSVEGVVNDKQVVDQFGLAKEFKVNVDGLWYLTTQMEFERATVNSRVVIQAAGPIDAITLCPK